MNNTTIYNGVTRLLNEPKEANGKKYPFAFDSDMPEELHTSYRLMVTTEPNTLTDASLAVLLKASKRGRLFADLERTEGYPLSWITIHPEGGPSGSGGGSLRVQFEKGLPLKLPTPPQVPPPTPEKNTGPLPDPTGW